MNLSEDIRIIQERKGGLGVCWYVYDLSKKCLPYSSIYAFSLKRWTLEAEYNSCHIRQSEKTVNETEGNSAKQAVE